MDCTCKGLKKSKAQNVYENTLMSPRMAKRDLYKYIEPYRNLSRPYPDQRCQTQMETKKASKKNKGPKM